MNKFTAKYALLPSTKSQYNKIINLIINGMNKKDADDLISNIKLSAIKFKYKHRTSLEHLGLLISIKDKVYLSEIAMKIKNKEISLEKGLRDLIDKNQELVWIFDFMLKNEYINGKKTKKEMIEILHNDYFCDTPASTLGRYLNPILKLFDISEYSLFNEGKINNDIINKKDKINEEKYEILNKIYGNMLIEVQKLYLKEVKEYGEVLSIEKISNMLKNKFELDRKIIENFWRKMYNDSNKRFRYIFTTLPYWGTKNKSILINGQTFTHIILLKNICEEGYNDL
ncbi:hypothetical protein [Clostridium botulinum]|uniref:hypothetical protein n=1 Tax=Clostridium botulinum TaxID=1491 RepID=UPI003EF2D5BA